MLTYETLVEMLNARVDAILPSQVMDLSREDYGGFVSDGVAGPTNMSAVSSLGYAYLLEGGKYYQSEEIVTRIMAGTAFGRSIRRESGCFDLNTTNFDSSPDTGFLVMAAAPVVRAARKAAAEGDGGAGRIAEALGEIIQTAVPGMVAGGFHTPNHRWVEVAAFSMALELFPELDCMHAIESYLAETIDINADGEYIERSTASYNPICNRALRLAADALDRSELLEPVRKNLDLSYHMLHADGTVETSFSRRQDQGTQVVLTGMIDSYYNMARRDGNGFYAAIADWLYSKSPGELPWTLEPFLTHPKWRDDGLEREPLPESYMKFYSTAKLWRVRRGKTSATAGAGVISPFSVRHGRIELSSVSLAASYFAIAQFVGETFEDVDGKVKMTHVSQDSEGRRPGYDMPLGREVPFDKFSKIRKERDLYPLLPLTTTLEIEEVGGGFDLHVSCEGYDRVPFQIACDFRPGGELDFECGVMRGQIGEVVFLKNAYATYHLGNDAISIGPGAYAHRFWAMRGSQSAPNSFRVLMTFMTPVVQVLKVRCGTWSTAEERIV